MTRPVSNVENGDAATFSPEGRGMWSLAVEYPSTDEDEA